MNVTASCSGSNPRGRPANFQPEVDVELLNDPVSLLVSTDAEILLRALEALASKTRSHRLVHDERTSKMIREFSYGWPGDSQPLDLLSCVLGGVGDTEQATRLASGLHFEFYDGKLQVIDVGVETLRREDCLSIFNRLVEEFQVPGEYRFGLLTRIRFAKAFESTETRHAYVKMMILALQLCSEKKLMPGQLKKLVRTRADVPESIRVLAIQTLTVYGKVNVFSPADREIKVEAFLSGKKGQCWSAGYVEAMLRNSSPVALRQDRHSDPRLLPPFIRSFASASNVLTWLEKELDAEEHDGGISESLLSSEVLQADPETLQADDKARLDRSLVKLFQNALDFGNPAFNRAAGMVTFPASPGVQEALMEALVSVAIPSHWELTTYFISQRPPRFHRAALVVLRELPIRLLNLSQGTDIKQTAKYFCADLERFQAAAGDLEPGLSSLLVQINCIMFGHGTWELGLLKELQACGGLDKLGATLQSLPTRKALGSARLSSIWFSFLTELLRSSPDWTTVFSEAEGNKLISILFDASFGIIGLCGLNEAAQDVSTFFFAEEGLVKEMAMVQHCLKVAGCPDPDRFILGVWKNVDSRDKGRVLDSLLDMLMEHRDAPAQVFSLLSLLVLSDEDMNTVCAANVASKVVRLLAQEKSSSTTARDLSLLRVLNHALGVRDGNIFVAESRGLINLGDEELRAAISWYGSSLYQATPWSPGASELLKLGEVLTRKFEAAQELFKCWKLTELVDKLLELAVDPRTKDFAARTLSHLLEDDETLYNSTVRKIRTFMDCPRTEPGGMKLAYEAASRGKYKVEHFLPSLSSLAFREPRIFLQATVDTCEFDTREEHNMVTLKRRPRASLSESSRGIFSRLLDHLLARLDDAALELLTRIVEELPVALEAMIDAGTIERVLEISSVQVLPRFLNLLKRHDKYCPVTRAMIRVLSSPEYSLISSYKQLRLCWEFVNSPLTEMVLKSLKAMDMNHPSAGEAAAAAFRVLRAILGWDEWETVPEQDFQGPTISDGSVKIFYSFQQTLEASGLSAGRFLQDAQDKDDDEDEEWTKSWRFNEEQLETLVSFLWLTPSKGQADLRHLLEKATWDTIGLHSLYRIFMRMFDNPGALRPCASPANGLWSQYMSSQGVPFFVLRRVCELHNKVAKRYNFDSVDEDVLVALLPLLTSQFKAAFSSLESLLVKLKQRGKIYPITLSDAQVYSICRGVLLSGEWKSNRMKHVLIHLITLDPALSPAFASCMVGLSTELAASALERKDYTYGCFVARLVKIFEELVVLEDARESLAHTLDPLWKFIDGRLAYRKTRPLIQAFFMAQSFRSDAAPTPSALELLDKIVKNHTHLVKLASPMLCKWPGLVKHEFSTKVELLRGSFQGKTGLRRLRINRNNILRDSYLEFSKLTLESLRLPGSILVEFAGEIGTDVGGLTREWYQVLSSAIGKELFTAAGNPSSTSSYDISYFHFAGRLVAKAIVDGKSLDINFSPSFFKHILGLDVTYQDIGDAEYLKNLHWLLENHVDEEMGLSFSVDVYDSSTSSSPEMNVHELVTGGSDIPVSDGNKHEYVQLLGEYLLTRSFKLELDAFLKGFYEVIPSGSVSIFLPTEMELLICGLPDINVADLKAVAKCRHEHQILGWFWDVVTAFDNKSKRLLLKFITGSSKVPFGGLEIFSIGQMEGGEHYLPTSHTCVNEILLPSYKAKNQLEEKLILAIYEGSERFDFL